MKKSFIFFLFAGVFTLSAFSQNWVMLTQREPAAPEIMLNRSNNQEVNFTVGLPGFFSTPITENGTHYQRISIQGYGATGATGEPEIPAISHRIAVPDCKGGITYSVSVTASQTLPGYMLYPVPDYQLNSEGMWEEVFTVNPLAYLSNAFTPGSDYAVAETGAFRNQKFVTLHIYPFQFNPATGDLQVATEMEITLTFNQPVTDVNVHLGPFSKSAAATFLNYEGSGSGFMQYDKAFEKAGFVPGKVKWITLTNPAQADTLSCDYLIITLQEFFDKNNPNSQLQRLAEHRAWYNGYDVAIVNVADILSLPFAYSNSQYQREQKLRTFIRRVYEGNIDPITGHSKLLFVLLVGDNYSNNMAGMPTSFDHDFWIDEAQYLGGYQKFAADYYFTCVTKEGGVYDPIGDLGIGRFSVENGEQLYNMVHKTINFETRPCEDESWRKKAASIYGSSYNSLMEQHYNSVITNLLNEIGWENYTVPIPEIKVPTLNLWNEGVAYSFHTCPGYFYHPTTWEDNLNVNAIASELHNDYKTPFIFCHAHRSGWFDDMNCFAEFITRYDSIRGAVGYIGASRVTGSVWSPFSLLFQHAVPLFLFDKSNTNHTPIAGELLQISKVLCNQVEEASARARYAYNLFGDPALNIMAEPTEGCRMYVTDQTPIPNGQEFIVPDDCILYLHENGKLIIEEGGELKLGNRVQVIGVNNNIDTVIHIKGGDFIVGQNVVFQDLPGGILLENAKDDQGSPIFDKNKVFDDINYATFNNTPLTHRGSTLNVDNCIFNAGSNLKSEVGVFKIAECIFNGTTFWADHVVLSGKVGKMTGTGITINFSQFNGNNNNSAVQLNNIWGFEIYNSTISGYETGISLTESGTSLYTSGNHIEYNEVSDCNTGIELFNSTSFFSRNKVYNCISGVKLFNNSYTIFDNYNQPDMQIIQDCDSIEIYACATSFPTIFRYNKIVDKNLGITNSISLIYWDVDQPDPKERDVRYNCWGKGFDPSNYLQPSDILVWHPVWDCKGKSGSPIKGDEENLFQAGLDHFSAEEYPTAEATFKEVIATYPDSRFAIAAMHELFALEHYTNQDFYSLNNYFASFTPADSNLFNTADFLATRCHVKEKNWQPAVDWYENRIENPPSYQDSIFAVIDLGALHLMMEGDTANGAKSNNTCLYRLAEVKPASKQAYETHKTALLATLPQIKKPQTQKPQNPLTPSHKKGALGECIPNPTNGNATIFYELYTEGIVDIQIFNTMGQLVKNIPIGTSVEGNHQVKISLLGVPAGLYHYTLFVNGERADARKLVVN